MKQTELERSLNELVGMQDFAIVPGEHLEEVVKQLKGVANVAVAVINVPDHGWLLHFAEFNPVSGRVGTQFAIDAYLGKLSRIQ